MTPKKCAIRIVNVLARKKSLEFELIALGVVVADVEAAIKRFCGIRANDKRTEIGAVDSCKLSLAISDALIASDGVVELHAFEPEIAEALERIWRVRD